MPTAVTFLCIASVIAVTLWRLHPSLLFSSSIPTGGDNGGHYALPAFLSSGLLPHWQLTGWDPSWYDGFPLYTYYFVLPDLLTALASKWHLMSYAMAFKWDTILGSLLLPIAAWAAGRLFGLRRAFPGALAALTLCYLFDYTYTIDGGNLFSTLAGEYSFSLGLAFALVFLGLMAFGLRTGRFRGLAAVVFALTLLAHLLPALFALLGAALLVGLEMLPAPVRPRDAWRAHPSDHLIAPRLDRPQALWWGASTVGLGLLLSAFWWVPFGLNQSYANSMGYTNVTTYVGILLPKADWWALIIAGISVVAAFALRNRFGILFSLLGGISALVVRFDPQASLYNTRFLPLWFLCIYLMVGWGIATLITALCDWVEAYRARAARRRSAVALAEAPGPVPRTAVAHDPLMRQAAAPVLAQRWPWAAVAGPLVALIVAVVVVVTPFVVDAATLQNDLGITPGANQVTNWSNWNYSGYQGRPAYPEYRALVQTMERVGNRYGCGQAMWEYEPNLNRFGTTMALMLLPYWSNGCIGSMEGLLFESSTTTPYHFLNQAELSVQPSEPMVGLEYSPLNVTLGIQHLQLLGVRYFMASDPQVQTLASADPSLRLVASTGPWTSTDQGATTTTTWKIYRVLDSPMVTPLANEPAVEQGIGSNQSQWLLPAENWYLTPSRWKVELAQSGPANWPRVAVGDATPPVRRVPKTKVTGVVAQDNSLRFHVSRIGTPILVKVSYYPNWRARGASGPYRVTPNLMVVVPTSHEVTLTYGATAANRIGEVLTLFGLLGLVGGGVVAWRRGRRRPATGASGGPSAGPAGPAAGATAGPAAGSEGRGAAT